ncbi:hypothetical protein MTR_3g090790 [Medicago truncatula]|uniref:Uncharacterized protein n=1 Tax=Medicago truncatula TaxID=3880 RepID=G7J696_MEDTR|nr:hypothetical protein MTR_3g090790 [Medicago truncatula]
MIPSKPKKTCAWFSEVDKLEARIEDEVEMCFLRNLDKNAQVNPQEKLKVLVMAGLATRKVGAEPGLVLRLAGGWLRP